MNTIYYSTFIFFAAEAFGFIVLHRCKKIGLKYLSRDEGEDFKENEILFHAKFKKISIFLKVFFLLFLFFLLLYVYSDSKMHQAMNISMNAVSFIFLSLFRGFYIGASSIEDEKEGE